MTLKRSRSYGEHTLQSSDVVTASALEVSEANDNKIQTTTFVDAEAGNIELFEHVNDNSYTDSIRHDAGLANFLSRPVLIDTAQWLLGTSLDYTLDVWHLFFNDSAIKVKLNHYAFLRCNLHVKVVINASPFYYGLFGAFYEPTTSLVTAPIAPSNTDEMVVALSQRPHIWCYPSKSQGGEMSLPFLGTENWIRCSIADELRAVGDLTIRSVVDLAFANTGVGGPVDIQVFAWAEDVQVCGPTIRVALQSTNRKKMPMSNVSAPIQKKPALKVAMEQHKCREGTISGPSSAIARATKVAAKIANFAGLENEAQALSAVSTAATCVSSLAQAYGCTDTPVISKVQPYKSLPFHAMSSADISQPIDKLTLDPQQELVMSGNAIGAPDADELDIEAFCRRESYLNQFLWETSDATGTVLFSAFVNPVQQRVDSVTEAPHLMIYHTPMALASRMFQYWRGDIVFRIRAICTDYHRGRLRIRWDPVESTSGATVSYATNYNEIFDIQENSDIIVRIPYLQPASFSRVSDNNFEKIGTGSFSDPGTSSDNGILSMSVFTEQSSPVANAPISLVISSWGENMEFAVPKEIPREYTYYTLQSKDVVNYDETKGSVPLFEDSETPGSLNLLYFGENITNFKQLMRRACKHTSFLSTAGSTSRLTTLSATTSRMPQYPGYDPNALYTATGTVDPLNPYPYNFCYHTPINWIGSCFLAHRGSINWQYNALTSSVIPEMSTVRSNSVLTTAGYTEKLLVLNVNASESLGQSMLTDVSGLTGRGLTNTRTQSGLAVNCPMFNNKRYYGTSPTLRTLGSGVDNSNVDAIQTRVTWCPIEGPNDKYVRLDSYVSIGPDFCYHFFLNVPTIYYSPIPLGQT